MPVARCLVDEFERIRDAAYPAVNRLEESRTGPTTSPTPTRSRCGISRVQDHVVSAPPG
jgi:hypothetical protein